MTDVQRALAALELAAIEHLRRMRQRLRVGDEELSALLHLAHHGAVPQGRLAAVTGLSRSGAGTLVQRLEEQGYVERQTDPADRRLRLVGLSAGGRNALATRLEFLLADHDPDVIVALGQLVEERDQDPPVTDAVDPIWRVWG
ncbi:MarR family winged helix-turn-helix transcriptional regulator [Solirubrobacter soli]|uniref:MarR family winged helix-turn-helix transcriptional regulator n=1 Tax=Solirubrobacter soli TaxID=363832 RepID=UPI00069E95F2|nr:helix-turn-helix domain-containing protein [Solirubrobacter soli]